MTDTPNNSNPIELIKIIDNAKQETIANSLVLQQAFFTNSLVNRFDGVNKRPMTERE